MKLHIEYTIPHANSPNIDLIINSCSSIRFQLEPEGSVLWQGNTIQRKMRYLDLIKFVASMDPEDIYPGKTGYQLIDPSDSKIFRNLGTDGVWSQYVGKADCEYSP
jgi:hypothetical protein